MKGLVATDRTTTDFSELHIVNSAYRNTLPDPLCNTTGDSNFLDMDYDDDNPDVDCHTNRKYFPNNIIDDEYIVSADYILGEYTNEQYGTKITHTSPIMEVGEKKDIYDYIGSGGNPYIVCHLLANWIGPVLEETQPYTATGYEEYNDNKINLFYYHRDLYDAIKKGTISSDVLTKEFAKENINKWLNNACDAAFTKMYDTASQLGKEENQLAYSAERIGTLDNSYIIYNHKSEDDRNMIKRLIMNNGICEVQYYAVDEAQLSTTTPLYVSEPVLSENKAAYYISPEYAEGYKNDEEHEGRNIGINHAVAIVGWDDNFSKDNFNNSPENDGAWLVRNSWNTDDDDYFPIDVPLEGDEYKIVLTDDDANAKAFSYETYFWLSYDDVTASSFTFFDLCANDKYDNNYFHTGESRLSVFFSKDSLSAATAYTAKACDDGETLNSVSLYAFTPNEKATIKIYKNPTNTNPEAGKLVSEATTEVFLRTQGSFSIPLTNPVYLKKGDRYSIVVTLDKSGDDVSILEENDDKKAYGLVANSNPGDSFVVQDGLWVDKSTTDNLDLCINGLTNNGVAEGIKYITYNIDCGYDTENPYYFRPGTAIDLKEPTMFDGYTFLGWYSDSEYKHFVSSIPTTANEDITLYAKVSDSSLIKEGSTYTAKLATKQKLTISELAKAKGDTSYKIEEDKSSKKVATISNKGVITAKKTGNAIIKVTKDNVVYTINLTVVNPKFGKSKYTMNSGEHFKPDYEDASLITTFSIPKKQEKLASINAKTGEITAKDGVKGIITVTASVGSGKQARKTSCKVKIYNPTISVGKSMQIKVGKAVKAKIKNGVKKTEWSVVDGTGSATIDSTTGKLVATKAGTITVYAVNNGKKVKAEITAVE